MNAFIISDRPGAFSGRDAVWKFGELYPRKCSQLVKVLCIYLFIVKILLM